MAAEVAAGRPSPRTDSVSVSATPYSTATYRYRSWSAKGKQNARPLKELPSRVTLIAAIVVASGGWVGKSLSHAGVLPELDGAVGGARAHAVG